MHLHQTAAGEVRVVEDAQLLTTVFGREFTPDPTTLFPGWWRASMDAFGMIQATDDLQLRENGQVEGEGGLGGRGVSADCRGPESIVLLGGEGTGGSHVFAGAQA
jgi:hypothetical protein